MRPDLYMDVAPPVQGSITNVAHSATAARYEVNPLWRQGNGDPQVVTFVSQTSDLFVAFGDGGVKAAAAAVAKLSGETLAPNWASGFVVPAGAAVSYPVAKHCSHYSVVSSGASGVWSAFPSSGGAVFGELFPERTVARPYAWVDFAVYPDMSVASAAIASVVGRAFGRTRVSFAEATNKPVALDAAGTSSGMIRPAGGFTTASSHKLLSTDALLAAALGGTSAFTVMLPFRRTAIGALHTLLSIGTTGSANGRWDLTLTAADVAVFTRVDTAGSSTAVTTTDTFVAAANLLTLTYDGAGVATIYKNRVATTQSGTASGDVGATSYTALGCRARNTSTYDQFASAEISEALIWNKALTGPELVDLHAWAKRRYGL